MSEFVHLHLHSQYSLLDGAIKIKELVRKVDLAEISAAMGGWLSSPPPDMRAALQHWAAERDIEAD